MAAEATQAARLRIVGLDLDVWPAFVDLLGPERGGDGGCWCTWWRIGRSAWRACSRDERRALLEAACRAGEPLGVLALEGERALGWCAVAPRPAYPTIARSRVARPDAATPEGSATWFISCFYVRVGHRRRGLTRTLVAGAVRYAATHGARCVEACPSLAQGPGADRFVGAVGTFEACGFVEVARRSPGRPLMRLDLEAGAP
ncbi:MAG: N-acetyltransferase family protein [Salinarimonas sp.]